MNVLRQFADYVKRENGLIFKKLLYNVIHTLYLVVSSRKVFNFELFIFYFVLVNKKSSTVRYILFFCVCYGTGNKMVMKFLQYGKKAYKFTYTKSWFYPANLTYHCSFYTLPSMFSSFINLVQEYVQINAPRSQNKQH